jgi:uncharacterized protein YndB with AHSA1/START domain
MTGDDSARSLRLRRLLPAPPAAAFEAVSTPGILARWWGPDGFTAPEIEMDLRSGGRYRIAMQPPEGDLFHLRGEFLEVDAPHRLVFTFEWEEPHADDRPTAVTLLFRPAGGATEVTMEQGPFATEERRALHDAGWSESLARLQALLAPPD